MRTTRILVALATVLALAALSAPAASAGGKGSRTTPSYTVTVDPGGPYSFSQYVSVTTNAPLYAENAGPWISLSCYQGGTLVEGMTHAGFPDGWYYNWPFQLGPTQLWTGGAADCVVTVLHHTRNKDVTDASTSFHVDA